MQTLTPKPMSQPIEKLTWSLVIPTYQREAILLRCLRLAAQQTLAPKEIIVIDASPAWEITRANIMQEFVATHSTIDWQLRQANRLSSAAQRNQGIDLATADIIFLIDDDSFMYPDCAEIVMRIYAQDTEHQVAGIMPALEFLPPDRVHQSHTDQKSAMILKKLRVIQGTLRTQAKRWIKDHDIFIPYDFSFPKYLLPETLKDMRVHPVQMIHGARMSFRRDILQQIRFEETLERYAVNEDNDVCYRASRLGMLLQALPARICHIESPEGRLSRFTTTALWGLNQAVLHRFHSPDLARFKPLFRNLLWRRLWTQTLKDLLDRRWSLPSTRGIWFALQHYEEVLAKTPAELRAWYPQFQQTLIKR